MKRKQSPENNFIFILRDLVSNVLANRLRRQNNVSQLVPFCANASEDGSIRSSFAYLARQAELRTLAGERERDTTRWQSCQRRPINLSSGCWHGDCRTELGWMARRAMRGHSRILHETVTEKLEAATAPMTQEKGGGERRGTCSKVNCT